jgi:hypothetical protein
MARPPTPEMKVFALVAFALLANLIAAVTNAEIVDTFKCYHTRQPMNVTCSSCDAPITDECASIDQCLNEEATVDCPSCADNPELYTCNAHGCNATRKTRRRCSQCSIEGYIDDDGDDGGGDPCRPCDPDRLKDETPVFVFHCPLTECQSDDQDRIKHCTTVQCHNIDYRRKCCQTCLAAPTTAKTTERATENRTESTPQPTVEQTTGVLGSTTTPETTTASSTAQPTVEQTTGVLGSTTTPETTTASCTAQPTVEQTPGVLVFGSRTTP